MSIAVGDVVILKSGGVRRTVMSLDGDQAVCVWSDNKGKTYREPFPIAVLQKPSRGGAIRFTMR